MKVLVVGGGGREHTYVWKIAQSPMVDKVYCVPGNGGIAQIADCRDIKLGGNFSDLADFAQAEGINLTVVGPEAPLAAGIVDYFQQWGLKIFGPSKAAAEIETSKAFAKHFMSAHHIPRAPYAIFDDAEEAINYVIKKRGFPIVVKADGLTAGKGSIVCDTVAKALIALARIMIKREWGESGNQVVIEEYLEGEEATFTALTDGETILPMATSQDHKKVFEENHPTPNPNTGGMGAISPATVVTPALHNQIMEEIIRPAIKGMARRGRPYKGALYAGLMITADGPKVLEFNCRLGDPELQVILPRLKSDLVPALEACIDGTLHQIQLDWRFEPAVCVVMASDGYPGAYEKGKLITGLAEAEAMKNVMVFHAGTTKNAGGQFITNGGRVLGVTALGDSTEDTIAKAYEAVGKIHFDKVHYRKDIGHRALKRR